VTRVVTLEEGETTLEVSVDADELAATIAAFRQSLR
jgi:hypothetical protein